MTQKRQVATIEPGLPVPSPQNQQNLPLLCFCSDNTQQKRVKRARTRNFLLEASWFWA